MSVSVSDAAKVVVVTRDSWGDGAVFDLTISATDAISGWRLAFDYAGEIVNIWNARIVSHEGERYVVENASYNSAIPAGKDGGFGFQGAGGAPTVTPVSLNDQPFDGDARAHDHPDDDDDDDDDDADEGDDDDDAEGGHEHDGDQHLDHKREHADPIAPTPPAGDYIDITEYGVHHGTSSHTHHDSLEGGRTAITTEALVAYNALRNFLGLEDTDLEAIGDWAFANQMTNNSQGWGGDAPGVGLYYAMQGAKVGWIRDDAFDPQVLADIQREARLGDPAAVMAMVEAHGHDGFAAFLAEYDLTDPFLNTLKMEPHYGGWMHGRTHGGMGFPDGAGGAYATAHDVNHLTVLSHDQTQPFMNDTFDWPQWAALDVPHEDVIDYFQAMVTLGDPLGDEIPDGASATPIAPQRSPQDDDSDEDDDAAEDDGPDDADDDVDDADDHDDEDDADDDDDDDDEDDDDDDDDNEDDAAPIVGDGGANRLVGDSADNVVIGRGGDDTLIGRAGEDTLAGGGGDDLLKGGGDEDRLISGRGDDTLRGGGDEDTLKGGAGDDRLVGGGDEDLLIAGKGRDVLVGGGDEDRFVFAANQGVNVICDFETGEDEIRIRGADSFDQLDFRSTATAVFVEFQGTVIKLNRVESGDLDTDDFIF